MLKKILVLVILALSICISCNAATNWEWIESNDYYGKFIAPETVRIERDKYSGQLESIEVWGKTVYSYAGAEKEINDWELNVEPSELSYSIMFFRIRPKDSLITRGNTVFYKKDGKVLKSFPIGDNFFVYKNSYYAPFFYYTLDKVSNNNEYIKYKSDERRKYFYANETDEEKYFIYLDIMTMRDEGNYVCGIFHNLIINKGDGTSTDLVYETRYNKGKAEEKRRLVSFYNTANGAVDIGYRASETEILIPGSVGDQVRDKVLKYFKENYNWSNRYNTGVYVK